MIYLKSALAGIVTGVLASAVYIGIGYSYVQARLRMLAAQSPTETYFVVAHSHLFSLPFLIVTAALFLAGGYWMFRRLRLQQPD
jgi:hypothetical protein